MQISSSCMPCNRIEERSFSNERKEPSSKVKVKGAEAKEWAKTEPALTPKSPLRASTSLALERRCWKTHTQ